jgi:hypothetical protein
MQREDRKVAAISMITRGTRRLEYRVARFLLPTLGVLIGACLVCGAAAKTLTAAFTGPPQAVFDTQTQACEPADIPDISAQAFSDQNNMVHLFATNSVARAMVGPNLNQLTRRCTIVYNSPHDPNPADFQQYSWPAGFFTADGRNVAALMHTEFHGLQVPGMCASTSRTRALDCWWNVITFAVSHDGGNSFAQPKPPANLVASLPYQFAKGTEHGPAGYLSPTGIVRLGSYYYAMINDWHRQDQKYGACLIRTADPFNPQSWRAWDGSGFNVEFIDPYVVTDANPAQHVCQPVAPTLGTVDSLSYLQASGVFVATQMVHDARFGPQGVYLNISADLIHWSPSVRLVDTAALVAGERPGKWDYNYLSILDPASTDRDFVTITSAPYLYYVRSDMVHPPLTRTLMRRQIRLTVGD